MSEPLEGRMTGEEAGAAEWTRDLRDRLRVMLHVHPLHMLRRKDPHRGPQMAHYDTLAIALWIFDQIFEHTGMADEVDAETLRERVTPLLRAFDLGAGLEPDRERHDRIFDVVMAELQNADGNYAEFEEPYPDARKGGLTPHLYRFRLLSDRYSEYTDRIVLRATPGTVNLLLRTPLDIESEQAATEAVIETQFRRGKFDEAVRSARGARILSSQYAETLRSRIEVTERDFTRVDWREEMPTILKQAAEHVKVRLDVESHLISMVEDRLKDLPVGSEDARRVSFVLQDLQDARRRHSVLANEIASARPRFLSAQVRQGFIPRHRGLLPDLNRDVLEPMLRMQAAEVRHLTDRILPRTLVPRVPTLVDLAVLIEWQLRPRPEPPEEIAELPERDLVPQRRDFLRYTPDVREAGEGHLRVEVPTTLSDLLRELVAKGERKEVCEYVAFRAQMLFAPDEDSGARPIVVQRQNGRRFEVDRFSGHDLVLTPLEVESNDGGG